MLGDAILAALESGDATELVGEIQEALRTTVPPKALERAAGLYVWKKAWEIAVPASRHGGDRRSASYREKDQSEKLSFCSVAAAATGVTERLIQLDIQTAEQLGADGIKQLWSSPIADNGAALRAVAALDGIGRGALFAVWQDNPSLAFGAAMIAARLRAAEDTDEAIVRALVSAWARAGSKARRRFLDEIGLDKTSAAAVVADWRKRGAT